MLSGKSSASAKTAVARPPEGDRSILLVWRTAGGSLATALAAQNQCTTKSSWSADQCEEMCDDRSECGVSAAKRNARPEGAPGPGHDTPAGVQMCNKRCTRCACNDDGQDDMGITSSSVGHAALYIDGDPNDKDDKGPSGYVSWYGAGG